MHSLLLVAKLVSWTLDPDRSRKTGSRYNDTLSCFGKPKGYVTMSQKVTVLFHCLLGDFWLKLHWGVLLPPPVAAEGLIQTDINISARDTLRSAADATCQPEMNYGRSRVPSATRGCTCFV